MSFARMRLRMTHLCPKKHALCLLLKAVWLIAFQRFRCQDNNLQRRQDLQLWGPHCRFRNPKRCLRYRQPSPGENADLEVVEGNIWFRVADNISPLGDSSDDVYSVRCHVHLLKRKMTMNMLLPSPLTGLENEIFS